MGIDRLKRRKLVPNLFLLATFYHCLAPDLLGFGESLRDGKTPYSVALQVEMLHSWLSALRHRAISTGHSSS